MTKLTNLPAQKQSEKTCLMDFILRLLPASNYFDVLKEAASSGTFQWDGKPVAQLNKLQRYTCIRKCMAAIQSRAEEDEMEALLAAEKTRDFSDVDELEALKILGAKPLESSKLKLFNQVVNGELTQTKLGALLTSFYNSSDPQQCEKIANLWLENIERVEAEQHRDYFLTFFTQLSPRFMRN